MEVVESKALASSEDIQPRVTGAQEIACNRRRGSGGRTDIYI